MVWHIAHEHHRHCQSVRRSRGIKPYHNAKTVDDTRIFKDNQTFTFTVFDKTIQTNIGKKVTRDN